MPSRILAKLAYALAYASFLPRRVCRFADVDIQIAEDLRD